MSNENEGIGMVSHAQNPGVLRLARDFYATYCASSDGKNYQGLACPAWDALTPAVRGHWYTVAKRALHLESVNEPEGVPLGDVSAFAPNEYVVGHLPDAPHALDVWREYSGVA
jgi:hypothetical protein